MRPWFIITDASGNILKDTMYDGHYAGQGNIYTDKLGGYLHWGALDSFLYPNPIDFRNLPGYVAHLDSSFRPEWLHVFGGSTNKTYVMKTIQLGNGDYLCMGEYMTATAGHGWASRISRSGYVKWERQYKVDTTAIPYLVDAKERPDKSIVLVGMARNTRNPAWRQQDIWLLAIDSNGCELPECSYYSTAVQQSPAAAQNGITAYPNPTAGELNIRSSESGMLTLYNLQGAKSGSYEIKAGKTAFYLPAAMSAGVYMGRFISADGKSNDVVRIVYQP